MNWFCQSNTNKNTPSIKNFLSRFNNSRPYFTEISYKKTMYLPSGKNAGLKPSENFVNLPVFY